MHTTVQLAKKNPTYQIWNKQDKPHLSGSCEHLRVQTVLQSTSVNGGPEEAGKITFLRWGKK